MTDTQEILTPHQALFQAVDTEDQAEIARLLTQIDANIKDAAGLTVMVKLLVEGEGDIIRRLHKAWNFHDKFSAGLDDMVQGLAAAGYVERADELREHYNVPPIKLALGLAYSGNKQALDEYFIKYEQEGKELTQKEQIAKVEALGTLAHSLLVATATYGGEKGYSNIPTDRIS